MRHYSYILLLTLVLIGCGGRQNTRTVQPPAPPEKNQTQIPENTQTPSGGGYYLDDGPEANPPSNLDEIPDAVPKVETPNPHNSKPYVALGETYTPMTTVKQFKQSGVASWYGKRFHGNKTASGEPYDMYAMTAAHPTLPIPSYVKVTNPANKKSVIVRVNDRGPFKHDRIIDLSYAAAHKLRIIKNGSAYVNIEVVTPETYQAETSVSDSFTGSNGTNSRQESPNVALNSNTDMSGFFVQAGAFKNETNANLLRQKIINLGITTRDNINKVYNSDLYRLRLGPFDSESIANQIAAEIRKQLNISSIIHRQ
jgi:rare lipoprotein A